jgi:hypothetical protein
MCIKGWNNQNNNDYTTRMTKYKFIEAMGLKSYCVEVTLNGIISVPNFIKIYQAVQKLLVGDTQTDRLVT